MNRSETETLLRRNYQAYAAMDIDVINELAGDGIYQFVAAFRNNQLDYEKYYQTLPLDQALKVIAG